MKNLFIPYEIALKLKEKGFNEPCFGGWIYSDHRNPNAYLDLEQGMNFEFEDNRNENFLEKSCSAPLYQQAIQWLLQKLEFNYPYIRFEIYTDGSGGWLQNEDSYTGNPEVEVLFNTLDEAIEEGLKLLELK